MPGSTSFVIPAVDRALWRLGDESVESVYQNDRVNEDPHVVYLRKLEREQIRLAIADLPEL